MTIFIIRPPKIGCNHNLICVRNNSTLICDSDIRLFIWTIEIKNEFIIYTKKNCNTEKNIQTALLSLYILFISAHWCWCVSAIELSVRRRQNHIYAQEFMNCSLFVGMNVHAVFYALFLSVYLWELLERDK